MIEEEDDDGWVICDEESPEEETDKDTSPREIGVYYFPQNFVRPSEVQFYFFFSLGDFVNLKFSKYIDFLEIEN